MQTKYNKPVESKDVSQSGMPAADAAMLQTAYTTSGLEQSENLISQSANNDAEQ